MIKNNIQYFVVCRYDNGKWVQVTEKINYTQAEYIYEEMRSQITDCSFSSLILYKIMPYDEINTYVRNKIKTGKTN